MFILQKVIYKYHKTYITSFTFSSETESVQSDTTNEYENLIPLEKSQQNEKLWPNLARMCERYQVSDQAGAAIANSTLQDAGIIQSSEKLFAFANIQ